MDKEKVKELAEYARKFFTCKRRGEEDICGLKDRYPTWLYDMMRFIHEDGNWFSDDYKYEFAVDALNHLIDGMDPEEPELEADVYTSDLLKWLGSHRERLGIVDEAVKEYGWDPKGGIESAISLGQWHEKESVFRSVVSALEERLEDIENGIEEVFKSKKGGPEGVIDWEPT
jgi:hypothetical protein